MCFFLVAYRKTIKHVLIEACDIAVSIFKQILAKCFSFTCDVVNTSDDEFSHLGLFMKPLNLLIDLLKVYL